MSEVYVCDSRAIPFYSFDDKQNKYKRILYLGTHITTKSLNWGFYYFGVGNKFWSIIKEIYNSKSLTQAIDDYKEEFDKTKNRFRKDPNGQAKRTEIMSAKRESLIKELQEHGIVVNDLIGLCKCTGAKDKEIIDGSVVPNDGRNGFHDVPALMRGAEVIVINGKGLKKNGETAENSARYYLELFGFLDNSDIKKKIVYVKGSSSRGSIKELVASWKGEYSINGVLS